MPPSHSQRRLIPPEDFTPSISALQQATMQALPSATGLATERKPSLALVSTAVRSMIKELLEELLIIFLKFKAWLCR
jgi:hypothetical protein